MKYLQRWSPSQSLDWLRCDSGHDYWLIFAGVCSGSVALGGDANNSIVRPVPVLILQGREVSFTYQRLVYWSCNDILQPDWCCTPPPHHYTEWRATLCLYNRLKLASCRSLSETQEINKSRLAFITYFSIIFIYFTKYQNCWRWK